MMGMDNPPSSTVLRQCFKTPDSWGGGSAVQGLHIYGSVLGGAGGDSSEQRDRESWITSQRQFKG